MEKTELTNAQKQNRVRQRISKASIDPDKYEYISKRTYLGNLKWTASGVAASMRNERYCGDVLTRKRFTNINLFRYICSQLRMK